MVTALPVFVTFFTRQISKKARPQNRRPKPRKSVKVGGRAKRTLQAGATLGAR
jgi:hypothetical protein